MLNSIDKFGINGIIYCSIMGWMAILAPLKASFVVLLIVISADFITGVMASKIKRVPISSHRLRRSIFKMTGYFNVLFLLFVIEYGFGFDIGSYKFIGGFICVVELISILENTAIITGNPIFMTIVKIIRGRASDTYGNVVEEILKDKNNG